MGTVRRCVKRTLVPDDQVVFPGPDDPVSPSHFLAVKTIDKSKLKNRKYVQQEADIAMRLDHPSVCRTHEVFEEGDYTHIVMDLCTGGELFERITHMTGGPGGCFSERMAASIAQQMLKAVAYLHSQVPCLFIRPLTCVDYGLWHF